MNYRQFVLRALFLVFAFSLQSHLVLAQEEPQQPEPQPVDEKPPKPAGRPPFPVIDLGSHQDENQDQNGMQPDITPLTGLQTPTLGTPGIRHSYWVPGLQYGSTIVSNPSYSSGSSNWFADNYFLGNLTLLKAWSRSQFVVNYSAGGFVSTGNNQGSFGNNRGSGESQQLAMAQNFQTNRWLFQILDRFSYLPQSQFGYGAGTNLGVPGVGGSLGATIPGLGGAIPDQSIFSTNGPIYSNTGALQATYAMSPRSSITVAGAYGMLRFVDRGNIDSDTILGSLGYNYNLGPKDAIGIVYRFASYHYQGPTQAFGDHYASFVYSRKITGRLALRLLAGPRITTFRIPIGTDSQKIGFHTSANLTYGTRNGAITASYIHGFSGGSGILVGSTLDQVNFSGTRRLGRVWGGSVNFGYAHNAGLVGSGQLNSPSYDSWFGGAGLNRPLGRYIHWGLSYAAYFSKSSLSGCTGTACGNTNTVNSVNVSLQWHTRPFVLE